MDYNGVYSTNVGPVAQTNVFKVVFRVIVMMVLMVMVEAHKRSANTPTVL